MSVVAPTLAKPVLEGVPAGARVVVAMSGGVDSSVVAALLARGGFDVVGITLQLYDHGAATGRKGACCAGQDIDDARRAAEVIGIPHYVLDYEQRFEKTVVEAFADSYLRGETPVPCAVCNQKVKFEDLLATAAELGAVALATGHYVDRHDGPCGPVLMRAADASRDQSYFLFGTTRDQLRLLRFPLGGLRKTEVRALAREWGLPVAGKPDSQDICFVSAGRYSDVIARLRPEAAAPGAIVHVDGRVLGQHPGIVHFTIGQRRRLGVAGGEPLYVVRLDPGRREVVVGPRSCLHAHVITLNKVNWLDDEPLHVTAKGGLAIHVRVRSTQAPQPASLFVDSAGAVSVLLRQPEQGIAPGQACVFYANGSPRARVLGGGWIGQAANSLAEAGVARLGTERDDPPDVMGTSEARI